MRSKPTTSNDRQPATSTGMTSSDRQQGSFAVRATLAAAAATVVLGGCIEQDAPPYSSITNSSRGSAGSTEEISSDATDSQTGSDKAAAASTADADTTRLYDKTFDDLKFDIEPDEPFEHEKLSDEVKALFDKRIRIRGYIRPTFQREGITQFVFVRDNLECCFGPGAALYDCIIVDMLPGKTANFTTRPVSVQGKFTLDEFIGPEGNHLAIFHLDGEKVE